MSETQASESRYPVDLQLDAPPEIANWRPLVQWVLGIPHLILANVLNQVASVVALISWVAILFTGKLPAGLATFQCMALRYQSRAWSYALWLREAYPPFDLTMSADDPGGDPLRVDVDVDLEDRNRLTVGLRLLWAVPIALFLMVVALVASVAILVAFFAVLFTGRWPEGLRTFVVGTARLSVRTSAYLYLLVDDYPPFTLT